MFRPCYNLTWFHGIASLVCNDEMADLLAAAIDRLQQTTDFLQCVSADLKGNDVPIELDENAPAAYDYGYFQGTATLSLTKPAAGQIASAVLTGEKVQPALYALARELQNFATYERAA